MFLAYSTRLQWAIGSLALGLGLLPSCSDPDDPAPADGDADADVDLVFGDEACASCDAPPECGSNEVLSCCVCVKAPTPEYALERTSCGSVDEECGDGAPDLDCFHPDNPPEAGTPQDVTVYGVTDVFGNGVDADNITLEIYSAGAGCDSPGTLLATTTALVEDCEAALGVERCREEDPKNEGEFRSLGYYEFADPVPSETLLVLRTSGNPALWKDLVVYNLYFANAALEDGQRAFYRARVLSTDDYRTIPATAGMPAGISPGNGALAGEVHDCADVRLAFAHVATEPRAAGSARITYFNDNPDNPLPVASRSEGTSLLGLWAALNMPAGPTRVVAVGHHDEQIASVGWFDTCVFEDTVSVVTFRGLRPQQVTSP